ncbi:MAG: VCBS repeat-containing protein, partial [Planctomycetales bacterium]|nr:VCBS repeat-containing protein [Planctomycetales bacterium]
MYEHPYDTTPTRATTAGACAKTGAPASRLSPTRRPWVAALALAIVIAWLAWPATARADAPFGAKAPIATDAVNAVSVYAADVDGDGDLDALSASFLDDTIAWYENTAGDGSAWTKHTIATDVDGATSVYAADVDGDGDIDAISASRNDDTVAWYENTAGDGSAWTEHTIATDAYGARFVYAADVD